MLLFSLFELSLKSKYCIQKRPPFLYYIVPTAIFKIKTFWAVQYSTKQNKKCYPILKEWLNCTCCIGCSGIVLFCTTYAAMCRWFIFIWIQIKKSANLAVCAMRMYLKINYFFENMQKPTIYIKKQLTKIKLKLEFV